MIEIFADAFGVLIPCREYHRRLVCSAGEVALGVAIEIHYDPLTPDSGSTDYPAAQQLYDRLVGRGYHNVTLLPRQHPKKKRTRKQES